MYISHTRLLFPIAIAALVLLYTEPASAQDIYVRGGAIDTHQHGYEHGYRDGFERGLVARENGGSPDYRTTDFARADRGYEAYMGPLEVFRGGYKDGYRNGYDDGYAGNRNRIVEVFRVPSYDPDTDRSERGTAIYVERHWPGADVARDIGFRDGLAAGARDASTGHSFRPQQHDAWKDADRGYHSSFGLKEDYKRVYRDAFENGYRDGYGARR